LGVCLFQVCSIRIPEDIGRKIRNIRRVAELLTLTHLEELPYAFFSSPNIASENKSSLRSESPQLATFIAHLAV